jgi:AcrR family transcriptional regulator
MSNPAETRGRGRPAVSSRSHIEDVAMRLFTENGYAATTVPMIAEASGVGRATVFRYWRSKSEIVWAEFDQHIRRLTELLAGEVPAADNTLDFVRRSVVANLGRSIEDSNVWLERFALVDESEELRSDEARRWADWADWAGAVATFVAIPPSTLDTLLDDVAHQLEPLEHFFGGPSRAVPPKAFSALRSRWLLRCCSRPTSDSL